MQHVFIDVEAYGPPGIGRPFALGACKFDKARGVYARFQVGITWTCALAAHQQTFDWLLRQPPYVLAQGRLPGPSFERAWRLFMEFVHGSKTVGAAMTELLVGVPKNEEVTFWADDWSDFAWLDFEARQHTLSPLRETGAQYDSSAIVALADPLRIYNDAKYGELKPHLAEHDAVRGALDLIASLHLLNQDLP